MKALAVIDRYYSDDSELRRLLLHHSWQVAFRALCCAAAHPELHVDKALLLKGALLHDVGVFATHAPSIHCHGRHHYLLHGLIGGHLLRVLGLEAEARICERHTGTGLPPQTVAALLDADPDAAIQIDAYKTALITEPETVEEQMVCYADKFYSKSRSGEVLTFEQAHASLLRFGREGAAKFAEWHRRFAINEDIG